MPPTFGRYELLKRLAGGGMGEVYLARQRGLAGFEKLLVVKTLLPHLCEDDEFIHMFQDEARISAQLIHPNICQTFEFDQAEGAYYIAMEYLRGEDVRRLWKAASHKGLEIPVPLICRIISDAAAGLDFAHSLKDSTGQPYGIVHRDISPQNILVTFEGGVKIIDFGVAKAAGRLTQTRTGALKGKYSYMSPEQVQGENIDSRTDIFALGIVLHELLTAVRLFKADSDISTIERVKKAPIPAPSELNPALPKGLDPIVLKALARDPEQRYQTAQQFRLAIEDYLVQERMSASSAHLAEFLKTVYKERLELESKHGPLLGAGETPMKPSSVSMGRSASQSSESHGLPFPSEKDKGSTKVDRISGEHPKADATRAERDRTPSKPTNPGPEEPSKKSVIDLSDIRTEKSVGPFKGKPALKIGSAAALAVAIIGGTIWMMRSKAPAPAQQPVQAAAVVPTPVPAQQPPQPPAQQVQTILVKSDPEGAAVADGARIIGTTPFVWKASKGDKRTLSFRLAGYRDEEHQFTVGDEPELAVRLKRVEGPRTAVQKKRESPPPPPPQQQPPPDEAIKLER